MRSQSFGLGRLDPRTKILLLLATNIVALTRGQSWMLLCTAVVSIVCLISIRAWHYLAVYAVLITMCAAGMWAGIMWPHTGTKITYSLGYFIIRYSILVNMLVFLFRSTTSSEFIAAAKSAHLPPNMVLSMSVVFRFFPTIGADIRAIRDAMRLRGVLGSPATVLRHPLRTTTYVMVPLMTSMLKAGDELTASALTRGIGGEQTPTSLIVLKARWFDVAVIIFSIALVAAMFLERHLLV